MTDAWAERVRNAPPAVLDGSLVRLVESQEQVATNALVSTLAEQALLEELIEASKPPVPRHAAPLHYLLSTPFRYPPLTWGSRFGSRFEPSLFYGARTAETALAESAFYRFVFWAGMSVPPPAPLDTRHTLFTATIRTDRGLQLQHEPFAPYAAQLTDRRTYSATQALGAAMRAAGIDAFEYTSARDPAGGLNVALFSPTAFPERRPTSVDEWLCETRGDRVTFYSRHGGGIRDFPSALFLVDGALPVPPQ